MKRYNLLLYVYKKNCFRTVFKTQHGREIYLELRKEEERIIIKECFYLDRIRNEQYYATPKKLTIKACHSDELLAMIASQLDRKFYGLEIISTFERLTQKEFISLKLSELRRGYKFLIFVAEGECINYIPKIIRTRFQNRIHRGIYLEMRYYGDGKGIISDCHYYDRQYKGRRVVVPETLSTVYFSYNRQAILNIANNELNANFNSIIFVTDNSINIKNKVALCGNI